MNKFVKGDLVYIPQAVSLSKDTDGGRGSPAFMRLKYPRNCLVVKGNDDEGTVSILYDGEIWQANTSDIYPVKDPLKGEVRFV